MSGLSERLDDLYTQRADLKERMATIKRDPEVQRKLIEAALDAKMRRLSPDASLAEIFSAGVSSWAKLEDLKEEGKWIERQICALLTNPGLATRDLAT